MHVTLDQEHWESGTTATLGEVLVDLSERAHAQARIVTSLTIDRRIITDRDLDSALMAESTSRFAQLTATSQAMQTLVESATTSATHYAELLHLEAQTLIKAFRAGIPRTEALDAWLGKMADYLELLTASATAPSSDSPALAMATWLRELLDARAAEDGVRMADLLEYEILPRLAA